MRPLAIALKDLHIVARDRKALAIILAMPIILVAILGAALGPMFAKSDSISPFSIAVVDLDRGDISRLFREILASDRIETFIKVQDSPSEDDARSLVRKGTVACAVIIPGGSDPGNPEDNSFVVIGDPANPIRSQIVGGIVSSFTEQYSVIVAGTSGILDEIMKAAGPSFDVQDFVDRVVRNLSGETSVAAGMFVASTQQSSWITALQYYTVSMTVMFVLYGGLFGSRSILDEKRDGTMSRLFTTKAVSRDIIAGKTIATFLISFLQILCLMLFTRFVYRVSWGPSVAGALLVSAALAFAATGFAMLIASLSKTEKMADALENLSVQLLAFLGGCQYPFYAFPETLQKVSRLTLTRWGLDAYLTLMSGQGVSGAIVPAAVLGAMGLVFLSIGIWRLRLN